MTGPKPVELTDDEIRSLEEPLVNWAVSQVWLDDTDPLCIEVAVIVAAREAAARREALLEAADAWDNADPRDLDYLARRFYRAGGPSTPTIWLRRRAEALAEPERDEEGGR